MNIACLISTGIRTAIALMLLYPGAVAAQDAGAPQDLQIRGVVSSFDGAYSLVVRDEQGNLDNVQLHQGSIINPTGMTLAPGMVVSVVGYNDGSAIAANEIDTPYVIYGGTPFYNGAPWVAVGPAVVIGTYFASPVWWHGEYFGSDYRFVDGHRYWRHFDRARFYRGGRFDGRRYIADERHGGWGGHGDPRVLGHAAHPAGMDHPGPDRGVAEHHLVDAHGRPIDAAGAHGVADHGPVDVHGHPIDAASHGGVAAHQTVDVHGHPVTAANSHPGAPSSLAHTSAAGVHPTIPSASHAIAAHAPAAPAAHPAAKPPAPAKKP